MAVALTVKQQKLSFQGVALLEHIIHLEASPMQTVRPISV